MEESEDKNNPTGRTKAKKANSPMGFTLLIGIAFGVAVGAATDNMGTWLAIGTAIGLALGGIGTVAKNRKEKE